MSGGDGQAGLATPPFSRRDPTAVARYPSSEDCQPPAALLQLPLLRFEVSPVTSRLAEPDQILGQLLDVPDDLTKLVACSAPAISPLTQVG
jgi:hypothetical protein